jgi:hypothetical protein
LPSPYKTILNEKLCGGKQTTLDSFFKKTVKEKSVMGNEPNDTQQGPSGLQSPVMQEDDEMAVDNLLSFLPLLHFLSNPKPATNTTLLTFTPIFS